MKYSGIYLDGHLSLERRVIFEFKKSCIFFWVEGDIERSSHLYKVIREGNFFDFVFSSGEIINIQISSELESELILLGKLKKGRFKPGIFTLLIANALIFYLFFWSLPIISKKVAQHVPLEFENSWVIPNSFLPISECSHASGISTLLENIALDLSDNEFSDVYLIDDENANAYALPGGKIYVTSGLIEGAGSLDEVAAVMAHEIGHLKMRHVLATVIQGSFFNFALAWLWGDATSFVAVDPSILANIIQLKFSRDQEEEADSYALALLHKKNIDPAALGNFFADNDDVSGSFFSTHPTNSTRVAKARAYPKPDPIKKLMAANDFKHLQNSLSHCLADIH